MNIFKNLAVGVCSIFLLPVSTGYAQKVEANRVMIFEQPVKSGIDGNIIVPQANLLQAFSYKKSSDFEIVAWQPNPNPGTGGLLVKLGCPSFGDYTGIFAPEPYGQYQRGYRNSCDSSGVQMFDDVVGGYLNSADLVKGSNENKLMMTPQTNLAVDNYVFTNPRDRLTASLKLQVPVVQRNKTKGSEAIVAADYRFKDRKSGKVIDYTVTLFRAGITTFLQTPPRIDGPSGDMMVISPLFKGSTRLTVGEKSVERQSEPWTGWKFFAFHISYDQFEQALKDIKLNYPDTKLSMDPADYNLFHFHLNAELHYDAPPAAPTKMGWSMKDAKISWWRTTALSN